MFKGITRELNLLGNQMSREVDDLSRNINHAVDGAKSCPLLDNFSNASVIQLVSRSSGKTLQIVMAPTGYLVADGLGPEGPSFMHAHWTVVNEGSNIIRLHNNNNYIGIVNGNTCIVQGVPNAMPGPETKLRLTMKDKSFVTLESFTKSGNHVGVLNTGQLKSALATGKEVDGQFGVRLIYTPNVQRVQTHPAPGQTVTTTTTVYKK